MHLGTDSITLNLDELTLSNFSQLGIVGKFKEKFLNQPSKDHWLDHAQEQYGSKIVRDTKTVVNILVLYIPLPIYWSVYMQQGSRWVFQAARMNGDLGFYTVKPDQMLIFNAVLGMLMLPVCDSVLYPLMTHFGIRSYLHKMTIGGVLAAIAFLISAFVEVQIEKSFIHMMWLIPQHFVMALSEIFLYISSLSFSYTEAPASMKSSMQAFTFITMALGNLIVSLVSAAKMFNSQVSELLFYTVLLFITQIVFGYMASKYKPVCDNDQEVLSNNDESEQKLVKNEYELEEIK